MNEGCTYRDVETGVTGQKSNCTHKVLRPAHFSDRDQRGPLLLELWIIIEDLSGTIAS